VQPPAHEPRALPQHRKQHPEKKAAPARSTWLPRAPDIPPPSPATSPSTVAAGGSLSSSLLARLVLGIALGVCVLSVALAFTPREALLRPVLAVVYGRRDDIIFSVIVALLAILLGLGIRLWSP
jgi:hypothetical protein